jgi:beta-glucosidase
MDERTMREIYLAAFETVVKKAQPWTIMASYNKIGGVFASENKKYLDDMLRGEWNFEGAVLSDWGAVHDRVAAVAAGCDLTMPAENTDEEIVQAVKDGRLSEKELDACCVRLVSLALWTKEQRKNNIQFDYDGGHVLAREIARQSIILLKNENNLLPLSKTEKVAFIGDFAVTPRFQGGGSSHIRSSKVSSALETAKLAGLTVDFTPGYNTQDGTTTDVLIEEAVTLARDSAFAVVFAGLPDFMESEGVDRKNLRMPDGHNRLIEAVCAVQPNTVVVLHNGSPVEMPWVDSVPAIVEAYLGGQAVGEAVIDVLYGDVNPSGHLAESFPKKLSDSPAYLFYPGEGGKVRYSERFFTGYRYYESKDMATLFPFGHGLSYTSFSFDKLSLDKTKIFDDEPLAVSVTVSNTGRRNGKAVVQLYVAPPKSEIIRPVHELKEFAKVDLQPGESKTINIMLEKRAFAFWNEKVHDWSVENGVYTLRIGENAHTILLEAPVEVESRKPFLLEAFTENAPMKTFLVRAEGKQFIENNMGGMLSGMAAAGYFPKEILRAINYQSGEAISLETLEKIVSRAGGGKGSGLEAILNQPLSMMLNFLPRKIKNTVKDLLKNLNGDE